MVFITVVIGSVVNTLGNVVIGCVVIVVVNSCVVTMVVIGCVVTMVVIGCVVIIVVIGSVVIIVVGFCGRVVIIVVGIISMHCLLVDSDLYPVGHWDKHSW